MLMFWTNQKLAYVWRYLSEQKLDHEEPMFEYIFGQNTLHAAQAKPNKLWIFSKAHAPQ